MSGMKSTFIALLWLGIAACGAAHGQGSAETSDRYRQSLRPQGHVSDWANVLSAEQRTNLEARIASVAQTNGPELAVVVLPSLEGGQVDDFAVKLFEQWGVGKKGQDNGILFLVAIDDRKMRVEVGYGFEGVLTDAAAGRLLDEFVVPRFKEQRYDEGILAGAGALLDVMAGEAPPPQEAAVQEMSGVGALVFLLVFLGIFGLIVWAAIKGARKGGGPSSPAGGIGGGSSRSGGGGGFGGGRSGGGGASRGW
jgi:uncharacterized protein